MLRRSLAEHRALDAFLRSEDVSIRVRLECHVHLAVARLWRGSSAPGRRPAASRIGEWDARRRDDG